MKARQGAVKEIEKIRSSEKNKKQKKENKRRRKRAVGGHHKQLPQDGKKQLWKLSA